MTVKILFNRSKCIGCSACVLANRNRWRISRKDGKCILIGGKEKNRVYSIDVDDSEYDLNLNASVNCPVKIIELRKI